MGLYEDLLWRGLIKDVSNEEAAKRLLNEDKIKYLQKDQSYSFVLKHHQN